MRNKITFDNDLLVTICLKKKFLKLEERERFLYENITKIDPSVKCHVEQIFIRKQQEMNYYLVKFPQSSMNDPKNKNFFFDSITQWSI